MKTVIQSAVFWRTLLVSSVVLVVALLLLWSFYGLNRVIESRATQNLLHEKAQALTEAYQEEGIDGVLSLYEADGLIWSEDDLFDLLEEDDLIVKVLDQQEDTILGFAGIESTDGFMTNALLEHEELDGHRVDALRQPLGNEYDLIVGRFFPDRLFVLAAQLRLITASMVLLAVPMALITAYLLARYVHRRLADMRGVVRRVIQGDFDSRIAVTDNPDEFFRLSEHINQMLDRVSRLRHNVQGVSHGVAHDIKTPVSNIAGRLQLIERDADNPNAVQGHIQEANQHIETLRRTLDALLRLGEVEAGVRKKTMKKTDLSLLCHEMVESFIPVFEDADKQLQSTIEPGIEITGDDELLAQMLINLLENIVEHSRDGGLGWVRLQRHAAEVVLEVGDDGPGIPPNLHEQVFDRFYQMDDSRQTAGNGLGLSLVRSIAQLHSGHIALNPDEPGSVFLIRLPAA